MSKEFKCTIINCTVGPVSVMDDRVNDGHRWMDGDRMDGHCGTMDSHWMNGHRRGRMRLDDGGRADDGGRMMDY